MSDEFTAAQSHPAGIPRARSHPAAVAAMVFAWLMLAAGALVVVAYVLGWLPKGAPGLPALGDAKPAQPQAARTQSGVVLLPNETLVETPDAQPAPAPQVPAPAKAPAPSQPVYAKPAPKPAPSRAAPSAPPRVAQAPAASEPRAYGFGPPAPPPQYSRAETGSRTEGNVCVNCATITSIVPRGDAWEVGVRFDDGSREVIRYFDPPRLRVGDAVHLEEGRLIRD